jgi:hypothetical protein
LLSLQSNFLKNNILMTHKQILMTTLAAVMIVATGIFTGCKKDKDSKNEEDFATLLIGVYIGNIKMGDDLVSETNRIVVKYHSPKQIVFSIEGETFKIPQMGNVEAVIDATCIADVTKAENGYNAAGKTDANLTVTDASIKLPTNIESVFIENNLNMDIVVKLPSYMGGNDIVVNFDGWKVLED